MDEYTAYLAGLKLRHFSPQEITSYAFRERGGVMNSLPPRELWRNIVPTLWLVDQLREYLNKPITLSSIYRSHEYNQQVGGATQSYHMRNMAIDFVVDSVSPGRVHEILLNMRAAGSFLGGIGKYHHFTHVDTRGSAATWG